MRTSEEIQTKETKAVLHDVRVLEMDIGSKLEGQIWEFKKALFPILEQALEDIYGCAPNNYSESGVECFDEGVSASIEKIRKVLA